MTRVGRSVKKYHRNKSHNYLTFSCPGKEVGEDTTRPRLTRNGRSRSRTRRKGTQRKGQDLKCLDRRGRKVETNVYKTGTQKRNTKVSNGTELRCSEWTRSRSRRTTYKGHVSTEWSVKEKETSEDASVTSELSFVFDFYLHLLKSLCQPL